MTEEKKEEPKTETTYHDRVSAVKETVKEDAKKPAFQKPKIKFLSKDQEAVAADTIGLLSDPRFKVYRGMQDAEVAKHLNRAFEEPDVKYMSKESSFGEKMAFQKGFHYGQLSFISFMSFIWTAYLNSLKTPEDK